MTIDPGEVQVGQPLTLTIRIAGPGSLNDIPRPNLRNLDDFNRRFAVEYIRDRHEPEAQAKEFVYSLRPRSETVTEVPRLKFVYFNPKIVPPERGFQTTYADPVPVTVKPAATTTPGPIEVPDWMREWPAGGETITSFHPWVFFLPLGAGLVSIFCAIGLVLLTRWRWPDAARLGRIRSNRAARVALDTIGQSSLDTGRHVADAWTAYLADRFGVIPSIQTPDGMQSEMIRLGIPDRFGTRSADLLRACDAARFSKAPPAAKELASEAERLIHDLETARWHPAPS